MALSNDDSSPTFVEFCAGTNSHKALDPRHAFLKLFFGKQQDDDGGAMVNIARTPRIQFLEPENTSTPRRRKKRPSSLLNPSLLERRRVSLSSPNTPYSTHHQSLAPQDSPAPGYAFGQLLRRTFGVNEDGPFSPASFHLTSNEFWPNERSLGRCQDCGGAFSVFRRKHHCRMCGKIFCGSCSERSSAGPLAAARVCISCMHGEVKGPLFFERRKKHRPRFSAWFRPPADSSESSSGMEEEEGSTDASEGESGSGLDDRRECLGESLVVSFPPDSPQLVISEELSDVDEREVDCLSNTWADVERPGDMLFSDDTVNDDTIAWQPSGIGDDFVDVEEDRLASSTSSASPRLQCFLSGDMFASPRLERLPSRPSNWPDSAVFAALRNRSKDHLRRLVASLLERKDVSVPAFGSKSSSPVNPDVEWDEAEQAPEVNRIPEELARAMAMSLKLTNDSSESLGSTTATPTKGANGAPTSARGPSTLRSLGSGFIKQRSRSDPEPPNLSIFESSLPHEVSPSKGLPLDVAAWTDIICRLVWTAVTSVQPWRDIHEDSSMDIRHYIKVKTMPEGDKEESACCKGVVFRKSLANRKMPTDIINPRILLLSGDIEFERRQAMTILGDSFQGEHEEWLSQLFKRLELLAPDVVLVEKSAHRFVQDRLVAAQISLAINVKKRILKRMARCTQGKVIPQVFSISISELLQQKARQHTRIRSAQLVIVDHVRQFSSPCSLGYQDDSETRLPRTNSNVSQVTSQYTEPSPLNPATRRRSVLKSSRTHSSTPLPEQLGTCGRFRVRRVGEHTYFFFEDCPGAQCCTITLRGEGHATLKRIKYITQFAIFVAYNLLLESFFTYDSFGAVPPIGPAASEELKAVPAATAAALLAAVLATVTLTSCDDAKGPCSPRVNAFKRRPRQFRGINRCLLSSSLCVQFPELPTRPGHVKPRAAPTSRPGSLSLQATSPKRRPRDMTAAASPTHHHHLLPPVAESCDAVDDLSTAPPASEMAVLDDEGLTLQDTYHLPFHHQCIVILASTIYGSSLSPITPSTTSFSGLPFRPGDSTVRPEEESAGQPVRPPDEFQLVVMKYYDSQANDLTLGQFLNAIFEDHRARVGQNVKIKQRHYAHDTSCMIITVESQDNADFQDIHTWTYCTVCNRDVSSKRPLSCHSLCYSFGKFLEVSFYNEAAISRGCGHSLYRDMKRYFGHQGLVCTLSNTKVEAYDIEGPETAMSYNPSAVQAFLDSEWEDVSLALHEGYLNVTNELEKMRRCFPTVEEEKLTSRIAQAKEEEEAFIGALEGSRGRTSVFQLNDMRLQLHRQLVAWAQRIEDLWQSLPWAEADRPRNKATPTPPTSEPPCAEDLDGQMETESIHSDCKRMSMEDFDDWASKPHEPSSSNLQEPSSSNPVLPPVTTLGVPRTLSLQLPRSPMDQLLTLSFQYESPAKQRSANCNSCEALPEDIPTTFQSPRWPRSMPALDTKKASKRQVSGYLSSGTATSELDTNPSMESISGLRRLRTKLSAMSQPASPGDPPSMLLPSRLHPPNLRLSPPPGREGLTILIRMDEPTSIIAYTLCSKEYWMVHPFAPPDTIDEPTPRLSSLTSISSQPSLASHVPTAQNLHLLRREAKSNGRFPSHTDDVSDVSDNMSVCSEVPSVTSAYHFPSNASLPTIPSLGALRQCGPLEVLLSKDKFHFEHAIKDTHEKAGHSEGRPRTAFLCTVYYARQFAALRHLYCGGDDTCIIQSLSRCTPFRPSGGKSGSGFVKTKDERFVLKNISKVELTHTLTIAHKYFEYMARTYQQRLPTVLVKILGVFKISCKATQVTHTYVLMENLFYGQRVTKVYDLKGSMRNRFEANQNATLLDENLVKQLTDAGSCLFTREEHKDLFSMSIHNDTLLLAQLNVMDYSLLVGVDTEGKRLVVGIIDYIREYTIDKQMEYLVKSSGMMGGGKVEPTVIQPRLYKQRFRQAMRNYFLVLPTKTTPWVVQLHGFKTIMDKPLRDFMLRATFHFFAYSKEPQQKTQPTKPSQVIPSDNISQLL